MLYAPGSAAERAIIGPPVGRRSATEAATVAVIGNKLDRLTALVESVPVPVRRSPVRENAPVPTPKPVLPQAPTVRELAAMSVDDFRQWSVLRWSTAFDHARPGGSPYARSGDGAHPVVMPFLSGDGPAPVVSGPGAA